MAKKEKDLKHIDDSTQSQDLPTAEMEENGKTPSLKNAVKTASKTTNNNASDKSLLSSHPRDDAEIQNSQTPASKEEVLENFRKTRESVIPLMLNSDMLLPKTVRIEMPKRTVVPKPSPVAKALSRQEREERIEGPKKARAILEMMNNLAGYTNIVKPQGRKVDASGQYLRSPESLEIIKTFVDSQDVTLSFFKQAQTYRYLYKILPAKDAAPKEREDADIDVDADAILSSEDLTQMLPPALPGVDVRKLEDEAEALIAELETPVGPLTYPESQELDQVSLSMQHTTHHCSRVIELLTEWLHFLGLLDAGYISPNTQSPLKLHLVNYFGRLLEADFTVSHELELMTADERLMARYELDDIDLLILWFVSALQMHPHFRSIFASHWEQGTAIFMHPAILMRLICNNQVDRSDMMRRLSPTGKLVEAGLLNITQNQFPTMPLYYEIRPSEQVINLLSGTASLSVATAHYAELDYPTMGKEVFLAASHEMPLKIIANYLERPPLDKQTNLERHNLNFSPSLAFIVEGLPGSGRSTLVKVMASRLEMPVITVYCSSLASMPTLDYEIFMSNLFTDAELLGALISLRQSSAILTEERLITPLVRLLARRTVVCAICSDISQNVHALLDPYITFKTRMDANLKDDAQAFWKQHLNLPLLEKAKIDVAALSTRLALQPYQIQKATKLAYYSTDVDQNNDVILTNQALERATGLQVSKNIGNLAFISEPEISLDEVIVNDDTMQKIEQIIGSSRNRNRVLYEWGLSKHIRRGTGVIALFDGEPGTGKTHCAEAITKVLGLSLMRVNIASMVDKYIGETEKNLTTIFEQARPDMSLLLFDEADSLFTKRTSNVSKSNDRYSNMSVNVLLQLIERYEGVSILTTNLKNAIDPAFERRITYKIYFPMPEKDERRRLWQYMCPPEIISSEPIDYEWLSELEMSGGEIKNAVLTAAYSAATQGCLLNSEILYNAGVSEATAAGRVMKRYEGSDGFF